MSNTPQGAEPPLAIADRRLSARRRLPALAYIDLGENNGGIILNISEDGVSVTSAAPVDTGGLAQLRFQLPGSSDWLKAQGEIAWISASKKEAGIRFKDLSEGSRNRIRAWVSSEEFAGRPQKETANTSGRKERPSGRPPTRAGKSAVPEHAGPNPAERSLAAEESVASGVPQKEMPHAWDPQKNSERRVHTRQPVPSLAYVDLGENNGGIILNASEGGLAVTSAEPLYTDGLARMRFQLPDSSDWMELSGAIAWISKSKKEAGLRFVELSEDARNRIKGWISSEAPSAKLQPEGVGGREKAWRRLEMPIIRPPQSAPPQPANPDRPIPVHAPVLTPTPGPAPPSVVGAKVWLGGPAPAPGLPRSTSWGTEDSYRGYPAREDLLRGRSWVTIAVLVNLGVLIAFLIGWLIAEPGTVSRLLGRSAKTTFETSETASSVPASSVQNLTQPETPSSNTTGGVPGRPPGDTRTDARSQEPNPGSRGTNALNSSARIAQPQERALEPSSATTDENAPPPGAGSATAQAQETSVPTPSPNVNPPEGARTAGTTEQESSLAPKPAETSEILKASVSVNFSVYPSIRVPADLKSTSRQGASLQIGQLLSRVDPLYPEDAEAQRMEGTVKLHIIIGQDGAIESVESRGGPALLVQPAESAIRQWRYTPSSVGGKPVEAEEDITVTFRLLKQTAHPN
jgi:TonB family protein